MSSSMYTYYDPHHFNIIINIILDTYKVKDIIE